MFGTAHIVYMVVSFAITIGLLVLFYFTIKNEKGKRAVLIVAAISTVVLHFSSLWVDFFSTGEAIAQEPMLLPIYPCNVVMWMLLIVSILKKRENNVAYKMLAEFTFYAGVICGIIGIVLNENFANNPNLADWEILKGLLSHSTMIFGCTYLLVGGYVKIRVFNVVSGIVGLIIFLIDGMIINGLYSLFKLDPCNSMYMLENPFPQMPWLSPYLMGLFAVILVFVITAIYEQFALKKEERWYQVFKKQKAEDKK